MYKFKAKKDAVCNTKDAICELKKFIETIRPKDHLNIDYIKEFGERVDYLLKFCNSLQEDTNTFQTKNKRVKTFFKDKRDLKFSELIFEAPKNMAIGELLFTFLKEDGQEIIYLFEVSEDHIHVCFEEDSFF